MTVSLDMLKRYFQSRDDVYVSSNSFVYYVKGDPKQRVAPDLYVVKGVSSEQRPNYKTWEEGVVPQVVFEFTTESSRYKDLGVEEQRARAEEQRIRAEAEAARAEVEAAREYLALPRVRSGPGASLNDGCHLSVLAGEKGMGNHSDSSE